MADFRAWQDLLSLNPLVVPLDYFRDCEFTTFRDLLFVRTIQRAGNSHDAINVVDIVGTEKDFNLEVVSGGIFCFG
ncbi:MAG TPA: hypothetical protein VG326_07425 [Tepidisphaeraceae bacterium]|nr:hypothetical protein [Tepidisphaeraceae bacterium]